ncbi:type II toxin-antitoxin system YoeB family toxin [Ilyobacter polytropus]|uniref:type II toxin-antitoxin system YoeB family toxin n=1 Tax=Ilyobacter polytropus TaxID=167642 RepID=UPI0005A51C61
MNLSFTEIGWEDNTYWCDTDRKIQKKIQKLIKEVLRHPFEGIGKPKRHCSLSIFLKGLSIFF